MERTSWIICLGLFILGVIVGWAICSSYPDTLAPVEDVTAPSVD